MKIRRWWYILVEFPTGYIRVYSLGINKEIPARYKGGKVVDWWFDYV